MKTIACVLLLAAAAWGQQVAVPQGGSLGPSTNLSDAATLAADKLDGSHCSQTPAANTVPASDSSGRIAAGWIPLPTTNSIGGVLMDADCLAGNHVNGIDLTSGRLKCSADSGGDWNTLTNKPTAFVPSAHSHAEADITDLVIHLGEKAPLSNPSFTGVVNGETIVAGSSMQVGSGAPQIGFSYGTAAPTGICTAGLYWQQTGSDSTAEYMCVGGAWVARGTGGLGGSVTPGAILKATGTSSAGDSALTEEASAVISSKTLKSPAFESTATTDQSLDLPTAVSPAVSAAGHAKLSVQSNKMMVSENGAAYQEVAKIPSGKTQMFTDTAVAASQLPNPAAAAKGGVYSIDCAAGQHIKTISSVDGSVTCTADAAGSGLSGMTAGVIQKAATASTLDGSALSEDASNVNSSKPIVVSGATAITGSDGAAPSAPAAGKTTLYAETTNGWASINSGSTKKYMVGTTACTGSNFAKGYNADGTPNCSTPAGSGDVSGPASSVDHNLAQFNLATGKAIEDSGIAAANLVTATANFASGGLVKAAGANKTLAAADLSGDVTTSGGVAATLAAPFKKRQCEIVWGGTGSSNILVSGDDAIANNSCFNKTGVTQTITAVYCMADVAGNTVTVNPTFGATGTGTTILSGALTCGSSYAYSSTGTVSNGSLTDGSGISPGMGGTLNAHSIHLLVVYTVPAS